ncbi:hypothetical protein DENIS_2343 [Desulfonema ishimotonii]|uniref:Uncharacterized protein n=1 Tax=Desulfonema ishimotonii TaxID=45657 RepID=A0A401FWR3_9BACT|nr:hypothetical protein [Desulfonema ishimotonii]GBC61383.1 hypothetical protein DENIS_2343 [Desulfonema ishimotonii]
MKQNHRNIKNERFDITNNMLILACDVSRDDITLHTETPGGKIERIFKNKINAIEKELRQFGLFVSAGKYVAAAVVAESTGVYHDALFRIVRKLGMHTAYVRSDAFRRSESLRTAKRHVSRKNAHQQKRETSAAESSQTDRIATCKKERCLRRLLQKEDGS